MKKKFDIPDDFLPGNNLMSRVYWWSVRQLAFLPGRYFKVKETEMKERLKTMVSDCCGASLQIGGKGTTRWYVCSKCKNPCDYINPKVYEKLKL